MGPVSTYAGRTLIAILLIGLLGWAGLGCEKLDDGSPTSVTSTDLATTTTSGSVPGDSTSSTVAEPSTDATTAPTLASTEEVLPNGHIKSMGFIDDVWVDSAGRHLSIDYAEFVYGDEATAAARADGEIGPTEEWDLDFYIRNTSTRLREWDVSNSVSITTSTRTPPHDGAEVPCTWADFLSFWGPSPSDAHLHSSPWWIERDGDTVVKIDEQYLP